MATKKTSTGNSAGAGVYPEIATDSEPSGHEVPFGGGELGPMNTQRLKDFQFGETLDLALDEEHFKAQYDYEDFMTVAVSCRGRAFPWQSLLLCSVVNLVVGILGCGIIGPNFAVFNPVKHTYLAFIVAFLIVFRGQQSYAYFRKANEEWMKCQWNIWEAYQLMASHIRNPALVRRAGQHLIAFAVCLKACLRQEMQPLGDAEKELRNILAPNDLVRLLKTEQKDRDKDGNVKRNIYVKHGHCSACLYVCRRILEHAKAGQLNARLYNMNGAHVWAMRRLSRLNESLCVMHMISSSPFPWVYMLHLRALILFYLATIPMAILGTCYNRNSASQNFKNPKFSQFEIVLIVFFVGLIIDYAILGLEEIGNQLQNPFGVDISDLPMETFCKQIHENLNHTANVVYKIYGESFEEELDQMAANDFTQIQAHSHDVKMVTEVDNKAFRGLDTNKDGVVSKEEFRRGVAATRDYQEDSSDCS